MAQMTSSTAAGKIVSWENRYDNDAVTNPFWAKAKQ